jgi:hypothetical protein
MDNDNNSKVEFENDWSRPNNHYGQRNTSKMIALVIKYSGGIIKDEKQASYVVLIISILVIIVSLFILFKGENVPNIPRPANYSPR